MLELSNSFSVAAISFSSRSARQGCHMTTSIAIFSSHRQLEPLGSKSSDDVFGDSASQDFSTDARSCFIASLHVAHNDNHYMMLFTMCAERADRVRACGSVHAAHIDKRCMELVHHVC